MYHDKFRQTPEERYRQEVEQLRKRIAELEAELAKHKAQALKCFLPSPKCRSC